MTGPSYLPSSSVMARDARRREHGGIVQNVCADLAGFRVSGLQGFGYRVYEVGVHRVLRD